MNTGTWTLGEGSMSTPTASGGGAKGDKGDKGDTGTIGITTGVAGQSINAYRLVTTDVMGKVVVASSAEESHIGRILGVSLNAASVGQTVQITTFGDVTNTAWTFTPTAALYVGIDGLVTQDAETGVFYQQIGFAREATRVAIDIQRGIRRI